MPPLFTRTLTTTDDISDVKVSDWTPTNEAIQRICRDGTPDWISHPHDYRRMAEEEYQKEHERSCEKAEDYLVENQHLLLDDSARLINFLHVKDFVERLRHYGVQCITIWNRIPQQAALHAVIPSRRRLGHQYITYVQIPYMAEWSTWRLDDHGLLNGESSRGWRTVLYHLIRTRVISEAQASEMFGEPLGAASSMHRRDLYLLRNN